MNKVKLLTLLTFGRLMSESGGVQFTLSECAC